MSHHSCSRHCPAGCPHACDMAPAAYLVNLRSRGVKLYPEGKQLRVVAPPNTLTLADRTRIKHWQKELCQLLREEMERSTPPVPWEWTEADRLLALAALACRLTRLSCRCRRVLHKTLEDAIAAYQAHDLARLRTACSVLHSFVTAAQPA